ncbi:MAG: hypothetical protein OHK0022_45770 [Roseiflexaceae bacterium]
MTAATVEHPLWHVYRFIRVSALGATAILPLLGAASVTPQPPLGLLAGLLLAALLFHCYAYVLNDVIDLPLDRREPQRATFPLVRGLVRPGQALVFALAQIPLLFGLTAWLGGGALAYGALAAALLLMAAYNLWGKSTPFPPLIDLAQGLGWAALIVYGAALAPGAPTRLTGLLVAFEVLFIMLINGVHGPLRDLANDLRCGARTTAILFGARPGPLAQASSLKPQAPTVLIPPALTAYAVTLQVLLAGLLALPPALDWQGQPPVLRAATALLSVGPALWGLALLLRARGTPDLASLLSGGMAHLVLTLSALVGLFLLSVDGPTRVALLAAHLLPLLPNALSYRALAWVWKRP